MKSTYIVCFIKKKYITHYILYLLLGTAPSLVDHEINCTLPNPEPEGYENMTQAEKDHYEIEDKWRCFVTSPQMNELCTGR